MPQFNQNYGTPEAWPKRTKGWRESGLWAPELPSLSSEKNVHETNVTRPDLLPEVSSAVAVALFCLCEHCHLSSKTMPQLIPPPSERGWAGAAVMDGG